MSAIHDQVDDAITLEGGTDFKQARRVLANPRFMALFGSQILTQVGGNMVLFGLTVTVFGLTDSSTSVSVLLLTFLVPAVVFGAIAGVFVDLFDRRQILVSTNLARGGLYLVLAFFSDQLALIYVVTAIVATLTTFFAPAEAAMIPLVVKRDQLMTANSLFILALQASFVVGFAVLGPLAQTVFGTEPLILIVAAAYGLAGLLCWILPAAPPSVASRASLASARNAVAATFGQLREGLTFIRDHHNIFWSLTYLAVVASLIGVLGVLGPDFAKSVLGLEEGDLVVVLLPLGAGLVSGIIVLNLIGKYLSRRRLIEGGLIALAIALILLGLAQELRVLRDGGDNTALLAVVVVVAFVAGVCYAFVAVPAQTSLQEELPADVRGRVFGVLNMLVSLASFVPIIIVGPLADVVSAAAVIVTFAVIVGAVGILSIVFAHPRITGSARPVNIEPVDPMTITTASSTLNRPIRLRYIAEDSAGSQPIRMLASPVVPGRAGPRRMPGPRTPMAEAATTGRPRIVVIFTGGTISMLPDPDTGAAVPSLRGQDILARVPGLDAIADLEVIDWGLVPASHLRFAQVVEIGVLIRSAAASPAVNGVVVVQGTDVIEETAFAWDLLHTGAVPVVVVGAMRSASDADDDGPRNLEAAVRVAADARLRGQGVVVVMDGRVLPADDVAKMDSRALDAFQAPNVGALARVDGESVVIDRARGPRRILPVAPGRAAEPVALVTAVVSTDGSLIRSAVAGGAVAVVVEATGTGNTDSDVLAAAREALADGRPVALTTRCPSGSVAPIYGFPGGGRSWQEAGAILAGSLSGPKARVALALGLGAGLDHQGLAGLLDPTTATR